MRKVDIYYGDILYPKMLIRLFENSIDLAQCSLKTKNMILLDLYKITIILWLHYCQNSRKIIIDKLSTNEYNEMDSVIYCNN